MNCQHITFSARVVNIIVVNIDVKHGEIFLPGGRIAAGVGFYHYACKACIFYFNMVNFKVRTEPRHHDAAGSGRCAVNGNAIFQSIIAGAGHMEITTIFKHQPGGIT